MCAGVTIPAGRPAAAHRPVCDVGFSELLLCIRTWYRRWKPKKLPAVARALAAKELAKSVYMVLQKQEAFHQRFKGTLLTQQKQEPGGPARRAPLPN